MDDLFSNTQTQTKPETQAKAAPAAKIEATKTQNKKNYQELKADFISMFNDIDRGKHRYEVFRDFVFCAAAALRNGLVIVDAVEQEYLAIINRYDKPDQERIANLFAILVMMLEFEPRDALGELYMELEISSKDSGQFFTPQHISELMAQLQFDPSLFESKPFVKLSEPACGAGGMILAYVKQLLAHDINPKDKLFVEAVDIDRNVALMCYIQLSLWHVPAKILVGNTLTLEFSEVWYTPAYFLERWEYKLAKAEVDGVECSMGQKPALRIFRPFIFTCEEDMCPSERRGVL